MSILSGLKREVSKLEHAVGIKGKEKRRKKKKKSTRRRRTSSGRWAKR
jgi:hypothetical protein